MNRRDTTIVSLALAALTGLAVGCGSLDESKDTTKNKAQEKASFALASTVLGEENNTTYVEYVEELDMGEVSLEDARSYAGYATIGAFGDMFFVASGKKPKLTRLEVGDGGELSKNGELSFSQYVDEAPLYANVFVDETTAYLEKEDTERIIWNPKEMRIERKDEIEPIEAEIDGKPAYQGFRRGKVVRGDDVFQPFNWAGPDYYSYAPNSKIVVFDAETDEIQNVIDAPCPGLGVGTKDDDGNVYFTNWVSTSAAPVIEGESETHSPCAVRIDAGETTLNKDWTRDLADMTGGREVNAMRILEGSTAIAAVLDEEKVDPNPDTDPKEITYANNWELWRLDLEKGTGSKIPGIDHIAGGFYAFRLDGRMIVTLPSADYANTTAYDIPVEGEATEVFKAKGWVYQIVELK